MGRVINIVAEDNGLVASISDIDVIVHEGYKIIETDEEDV